MTKQKLKRLSGLFGAVVVLASIAVQAVPPQSASAAQITARKLTLQAGTTDTDADGIPDGGSMPGGVVNHLFEFTLPTAGQDLGSIKFQYCTTAAAVPGGIDCNAPTGLSTATVALGAATPAGLTAVTNPTANESVVSATSAITSYGGGQATIRLDGVLNPSVKNQTFFVRISTYASLNGSGSPIDTGTVAASTADPIKLSGTMPESLVFCTGRAITETNNVPDCTSATPATIAFNQLFSPQSTSWATSQMAASTNAGSGYAITVNGPTLTSGSNTIAAVAAAPGDISRPGIAQFGMNVALNDEPNLATPAPVPASAAITLPTGGSLYNARAVAPYGTGGAAAAAIFKYVTGNTVADSNSLASDPQVFTSTYMVNVPGSQPAGTYSTTLTYICTPTF
jgi:hypothetical protein